MVVGMSSVLSGLHWSILPIVITIITAQAILLVVKFVQLRKVAGALPGPPFNFFLGHIVSMAKVARSIPLDVHPHILMAHIHRAYKLGPMFVVDAWPLSPDKTMVVADPELAAQVTQTRSLDKHYVLRTSIQHIVGSESMLFASGDTWKRMRATFNPGFSASHLLNVLSTVVVDEGQIFCDKLSHFAQTGELVHFEEELTRLTVDVIGRVVLDMKFGAQTGRDELVDAFRASARWTRTFSGLNPFANLNPLRPVMTWWYERKMNKYLERVLVERFASRKEGAPRDRKRKHVVDLALEEHVKENDGVAVDIRAKGNSFLAMAIDNIKTFIFAGHDTTSSTMAYIFYLLNQHPDSLAAVRAEHDAVFGTDPSAAADLIKTSPQLLTKLPYTTAVIKEVLRLYPAASTVRGGSPDIPITLDGTTYPTTGYVVWVVSALIHRRADLWPQPDSFQPERFLPDAEVPKDAWRPFEKGPRNCIGQELAMLEMKIIMVLAARKFDVLGAYEEMDRLRGGRRAAKDTVYGERAYQVLIASAKPKDGMPVRIKLAV